MLRLMMWYLWLIPLFIMAGCNHEIYLRDGVTDGDTFYLAPAATVDTDPVLQSWVAYSLAKSVCQLELGGENPARQNSYGCEFTARNILADAWAEQLAENPDISDDYLAELRAVQEAGYLDEYTVYFFRRNSWQVPVEVDLGVFDEWRRRHLRHHRPQTRLIGHWGYRDKAAQHLNEID